MSQPTSLDALATMRIIDLTQPLGPDTILWPGSTPFSATVLGDVDSDGFYARDFTVPEHAGTHFDAPAHVAAAGQTVDQVAADVLVRPAVRLDVRSLCAGDPAFTLSAAQIESIEAAEGTVPADSVVLVCTGWDRYVEDSERYAGPSGTTAFPGIGEDAARLLVERGVVGVGIDTLGIDPATWSHLLRTTSRCRPASGTSRAWWALPRFLRAARGSSSRRSGSSGARERRRACTPSCPPTDFA